MCGQGLIINSTFLIFPIVFFFHDTATTEIYTLSLHDALPISGATVLTDQPWDARDALGWFYDSTSIGVPQIVDDPTGPLSPPHSVQFTYNVGHPGDYAPGDERYPFAATRRVYVGQWWQVSSPWQGASSYWNEIQHVSTDTNGSVLMALYGPPGGPYQLALETQFK